MARQQAVDMALDLARMPAFAPSMAASALPDNILEVILIAAESPEACKAAALTTGQPEPALVAAARFYVQQVLFSPDADCYRVLGIGPGDSRTLARAHMRGLLQWLHPDRNGDWDTIYAKRIVKAWREVSSATSAAGSSPSTTEEIGNRNHLGQGTDRARRSKSVRPPWIERSNGDLPAWDRKKPWFSTRAIKIAAALAFIFLLLELTAHASGSKSVALRIMSSLW